MEYEDGPDVEEVREGFIVGEVNGSLEWSSPLPVILTVSLISMKVP